MGEVWIRTISHSLVRADRVTEIASSRGSVHEERGYSIRAVAEGRAYILVDNSDLEGTAKARFGHARRMQAALLLAMDAAGTSAASISWTLFARLLLTTRISFSCWRSAL